MLTDSAAVTPNPVIVHDSTYSACYSKASSKQMQSARTGDSLFHALLSEALLLGR